MKKLRLAFAGTPDFAVASLAAICGAGLDLRCVITQPDRPAGRGRKLSCSPVKAFAQSRELSVWQPQTLRDQSAQNELAEMALDLLIVVAYGQILPQAILATPAFGCWNVHASLLPRWRGAAPIHRAILAGDETTGCSIMQMEAGLDTGPVLARSSVDIGDHENMGQLHDRLANVGAQSLLDCLHALQSGGHIAPTNQPEKGVTYASKVTKAECEIDWSDSAVEIDRKVRGLNPWPVAFGEIQGETVRIWDAEIVSPNASPAPCGSIVITGKQGLDVATGKGILRVRKLQRPGKKPVDAASYINARAELKSARRQ